MRISDWSSDVCSSDLGCGQGRQTSVTWKLSPSGLASASLRTAGSIDGSAERFNQCCGYKASRSIADEKSIVQIDEPDVPFNRFAHIDQALTQNTAQQTAREGRRDQLFAALHANRGKAPFRQKALQLGRASCRARECTYV